MEIENSPLPPRERARVRGMLNLFTNQEMVSFYSLDTGRFFAELFAVFCDYRGNRGTCYSRIIITFAGRVTGWTAAGQDSSYTRSTLFDYIDGGAELYLSYGFKDAINRRYTSGVNPISLLTF